MINFNFLKKIKLVWRRFKFLRITIFVLLILIPLLVFALNTPDTGYRVYGGGAISVPVFHYTDDALTSVDPVGTCIQNTSGSDYFIPTRKLSEWNSFMSGHPANLTLVACCGDGICSGSENNSSCPGDCTAPTPCNYWFYSQYSACSYLQSRQAIVSLPFYCSGGSFTRNCVDGGANGCASGYRCVNTVSFTTSGCASGNVLTNTASVCVTTYIPNGCSEYYTNGIYYSIYYTDANGCSYLP